MATYGQFVEFGPYYVDGVLCTLKIYHYEPGTTTLKNVWTDREKMTTAAQPLESDADGIASCYADGLYKFRIDGSTDGSTYVTLYTYDKVSRVDQTTSTGEGVALASATTITLGTDGDQFHVTGSTGPIGALSGTQTQVTLIFDSTPVLTHSGSLILQDSVSRTAQVSEAVTFMNEGAGVWREISRNIAAGSSRVMGCDCKNNSGTPTTQFDLDADVVILRSSINGTVVRHAPGAALTNNVGTAGPIANARDQSLAFTSSTFIHFYWIWNGTTLATLSSATAPPTGPTLPAGYTHWAYAGAVYFSAGSALLAVRIKGSWVWYETAVNAVSASVVTVETAVSISAIVPANALNVELREILEQTGAATGSPTITAKIRVVTTKDFDTASFFPSAVVNVAMTIDRTLRIPNVGQSLMVILSGAASTDGSPQLTVDVHGYQVPNGGE